MKLKQFAYLALFALATLLATPSLAHHGTAVNYDDEQVVTLKGTVTRFVWRNPHSALIMDVTSDSGEVVSFAIELPSPAAMSQSAGWTRRTFNPGDVVEIKVNPSKTGANVAKSASCAQGGCDAVINGEVVSRNAGESSESPAGY